MLAVLTIMGLDTSSSLAAVLAFAFMTQAHVMMELVNRQVLIISGKVKPTGFAKMRNSDESTFMGRVHNSHANCLENLPVFAAVVLVNHLAAAPDISNMAWYYVAARASQALAHWTSVGDAGVTVRFLSFVTSCGLLWTMGYKTVVG